MKEDLYSLLYLMMGELNASHLGITGYSTAPDEETADLGLLFDEAYRGRGLKIAEVLKRGPADRRGLSLKPGEFVLAIDGAEVTETTDLSQLLNGKVGETVALQVSANRRPVPRSAAVVEIPAVSRQPGRPTDVRPLGRAQRPPRRRDQQGQARLHPHPQHGRGGPGPLRPLAVLGQLRQGSDRPGRPLQRRRLHARSGPQLPRQPRAHRLPAARRRPGTGAAFVRPQVEQAAGPAHQQPLLQRRRDLPQRLPHAGPGQAGRPADRRLRHRHRLSAADRRLDLPHSRASASTRPRA